MNRRAIVAGLAATALTGTARLGDAAASTINLMPDLPGVQPAPPQPIRPLAPGEMPPFLKFAVAPPRLDGRPIICIVIDDLGVVERGTERTLALPAPMTLSWFPFAPRLEKQVSDGRNRGHEATLHMPMQAFSNSTYQTGPDPLRIDLPHEVNITRLRNAMAAVPYTVGLNNHMGSVATKDADLMALVAHEARSQGMLFLDSLTIGGSQGWRQAEAAGIPAASRDVFIDNTSRPEDIRNQIAEIERVAVARGNVIAIGHPRPHTLDALEAWMPTLAARGFALWPLAATISLRMQQREWLSKVSVG